MWARDFEIALALWLALAPFVVGRVHDEAAWMGTADLACAALVLCLALASYSRRFRTAHLAELPLAIGLAGIGWITSIGEATPASQNRLLVGLLLAMFAVVPSEAFSPPRALREGRGPPG